MSDLRGYQKDIVSEFAKSRSKRIVISCPTGSGKTTLAVDGIAPLLEEPIAWITHRFELLEQIRDRDPNGRVVPMMAQSKPDLSGFKSAIVDEGHHVCASTWKAFLRGFAGKVVALTATPYRLDGQGMGACGFSHIILGPDTRELTDQGWLAPTDYLAPVEDVRSSWTSDACLRALKQHQFQKGIVYCRRVSDAKEISDGFPQAACVHAEMSKDRREEIFDAFRFGKLRLIANHSIYTEGADIPQIDFVCLNRFTESRALWRQMSGRALRVHPGKQRAVILDLAGNCYEHGSIYDHEIVDLEGTLEAVEAAELKGGDRQTKEYAYSTELKIAPWKRSPKPVRIIESLRRRRPDSLLRKLRSA